MATMEGSLSKWTNVMKGWQYRWFVLDDNAGLLSYYTVSNVFVHCLGYKQIETTDVSVRKPSAMVGLCSLL